MKKSYIGPIIAGIILLGGGILWAWTVSSIDYTKMRAQDSSPTVQEQSRNEGSSTR